MDDNVPFTKKTTVRTEDGRIGLIEGYEDGRWKVLFEDGSEGLFAESKLKRVQILRG